MIKARLYPHKGARGWGGGGAQIMTCPGFSQDHHRSHQAIKGPSLQTQTEGLWQLGTQIKVSEEMMNCLGPSQGCSRTPLAPLARHETHHHGSTSEHLLGWGGPLPRGMWHVMGCRGRILGSYTRLIMGCLGEKKLKVGKERDQGGLGRRWCGKIKGKEGVAVCK